MFFLEISQLGEFKSSGFKYDNSFFKTLTQKYPNKALLVLNLRIFISEQTLQLDKFEGVDLKYDNDFFEFQAENTQMKHWYPKCIFYFGMKLRILRNF